MTNKHLKLPKLWKKRPFLPKWPLRISTIRRQSCGDGLKPQCETIVPSWWEMRLQRRIRSLSPTLIPPPKASSHDRALKSGPTGIPKIVSNAISVAGINPSGTVCLWLTIPWRFMKESAGIQALATGVRFPSSGIGSSSIPSIITNNLFTPYRLYSAFSFSRLNHVIE